MWIDNSSRWPLTNIFFHRTKNRFWINGRTCEILDNQIRHGLIYWIVSEWWIKPRNISNWYIKCWSYCYTLAMACQIYIHVIFVEMDPNFSYNRFWWLFWNRETYQWLKLHSYFSYCRFFIGTLVVMIVW